MIAFHMQLYASLLLWYNVLNQAATTMLCCHKPRRLNKAGIRISQLLLLSRLRRSLQRAGSPGEQIVEIRLPNVPC